ncbi:MAG: nitrogen assimilation transcriptional regulator NAC [Candidatus Pseudomonas phytovorans]|uniref:Nitrogen assimilation transcriptional regulator NAC n=1 Tax=Candidatus Pseudomonas phytovorans TaxID=3121377 RepID=A0AAJ5WLC6_9PSED|nr:nitrogen assimilation transcriptional regulator NAC [Pseudomonas sp.]WEK32785.1 MAG: nitrogen assimilation transcriptional regulator NAC [Pseudomonas sp.]
MNLRRLKYFVKIVDIGSLTQAADVLHIAQPALSQQLVTLEAEMQQQLLIRTKRGVTPTEAGKVLYAHAQLILRQCEQALSDVTSSSQALTGNVSVGLAPGTAAASLGVPLLKRVRELHPGITLYLNENYGVTLSELIMSGRMDMAVLYGGREIHGLNFVPLLRETLYLVSADDELANHPQLPLARVAQMNLLLPRQYNVVRQLVDEAFARQALHPRVIAEVESASTLRNAVAERFAATILPESAAKAVGTEHGVHMCRIVEPVIEAPLTLCLSAHLPLSVPAQAVKAILLELVAQMRGTLSSAA